MTCFDDTVIFFKLLETMIAKPETLTSTSKHKDMYQGCTNIAQIYLHRTLQNVRLL